MGGAVAFRDDLGNGPRIGEHWSADVPIDPPRPRLVRTIAARALGRYLVAPPASGGAAPLVVGFHGYGESAETWLDQVARVPAAADWLVVSVQALHRFYNTKTETTVGSWMTRLDRDQLIAVLETRGGRLGRHARDALRPPGQAGPHRPAQWHLRTRCL